MNPTRHKPPGFSGTAEGFRLPDGGETVRLSDESGQVSMTRYAVFPGIDPVYNEVHMPRSLPDATPVAGNFIEIDHCREGRLECQVGREYFYLAPGDISIHRLSEAVREEVFPTGYYQGITIQIDLDKSPRCLACFLEDVNVEPAALAKKFGLMENHFFALRQLPSIEHIFSELYVLPESVKKGYLKVKILELLLFLSALEPETQRQEQRHLSESQVNLAKEVCRYLTAHLEQHIPLEQLARQFRVSVSLLRSSFRGVYGTSVQSYMRSQRMQAAAVLLRQTDRTVLDIAGQFGYDNGSKFAGAFRDVMGVSPAQYRKTRP